MALEIYPSVNDIGGTGKKITELKHTQWMNSLIQNSFVISGFTFPAPGAGLNFSITDGGELHLVGYWVRDLTTTYSVTVTASNLNYIYLQLTRDGLGKALGLQLVANITGITPTDAVFLGTATADASDITAVDATGRSNRPWTTTISPVYSGTITPLLNTEDVFDDVAAGCFIISNGTNLYKQKDDDIWVYDEINHNWDALTSGGIAAMQPIGLDGEDLIFGKLDVYKYDVSADSWSTLQTWDATAALAFNMNVYLNGFVYGYDQGDWIFYKQDQSTGTKTAITFDAYYDVEFSKTGDSADVVGVFLFDNEVYIVQKTHFAHPTVPSQYWMFKIFKVDIANSKAFLTCTVDFSTYWSVSPIGLVVTQMESVVDHIDVTTYTQYIMNTKIINPRNGSFDFFVYPRAMSVSTGFGYIDHRWVGGKLELYRSLGTASTNGILTEINGRLVCNITRGTFGKQVPVLTGDEYGVIVMQEGPFDVTIIGL